VDQRRDAERSRGVQHGHGHVTPDADHDACPVLLEQRAGLEEPLRDLGESADLAADRLSNEARRIHELERESRLRNELALETG